jgi:hypothetical protein
MADVSIDASVVTNTAHGMRSVVFTTALIGYWFYFDGDGWFKYSKTTDGGATWGAAVPITAVATMTAFDVWYDGWTPGDSGTKISTAYFDVTGDTIRCNQLDTNGDTLGGGTTVFTGASAVSGRGSFCSITKTRSGYLYVAFDIDAGAEHGLVRSTNNNTSWSSNLAATFVESTIDQCLLFPATGTGDDNDCWAIYQDASVDALTMKMWDSSAAAEVESSTIQTMVENTTDLVGQMGFSGSIRHSDGAIIIVSCSEYDTATADMQVWTVTGVTAASQTGITHNTDITTNIDDNYYPAVFIDQNTDHIYVAYQGKRDGSEVLGTATKTYYTKSTDGGTTWSSGDTAYQEGATTANLQTWAPLSGNRFYVGWRVGTTLVGNKVNSVDVSGAAPIARTASDAFSASDSATRLVTLFRSDTESITFSDVATRLAALLRSTTDTETISESAASTKTKDRTASDAATVADTSTRQLTLSRSGSDAGTFGDVPTRLVSFVRSITDAGTFVDAATAVKTGGATLFRTVADAFTGSDSAARVVQNSRTASDAGTFTDAPVRVVQFSRSASDAGTFAQVATRVVALFRTLADAATFADAATAVKTGPGAFFRTAADAFTASESAQRALQLTRTVTNTATYSDAATRLLQLFRSLTDASTWADIATRSITSAATIFRTAADAFTSSDVATRTAILFRSAADASTYTQIATRGVARVRTATDAFSATQVATRLREVGRNLVDVFTVSDSAARLRALLRDVVNATTFSDLATAIKNLEAEMKVFAGQIAGTFVHSTVALGSTKIQVTGGTLKIERTE